MLSIAVPVCSLLTHSTRLPLGILSSPPKAPRCRRTSKRPLAKRGRRRSLPRRRQLRALPLQPLLAA
eukprot:3986782-Pleurochrysis_carterae.AAC.1